MTITLVTGPPCSGKSTHVTEHRSTHAIVVDLDALAAALGYPADHVTWDDRHPAVVAARVIRATIVNGIQRNQWHATEAWVIDSTPHPTTLRIFQRLGARLVRLDPGREECRRRAVATSRDASTLERIDSWYAARPAPRAEALSMFAGRPEKSEDAR